MPWSRVVSFTDPFSYQSAFRSVDVELFPTVKGKFSAEYMTPVDISGLYWHFVDIIWIYLFPLLYLIDRHLGK